MKKLLPVLAFGLLAGCASGPSAPAIDDIDIGLTQDLTAKVVAHDLNNPSSVSFRPGDGALTICDSGNGRVLIVQDGKTRTLIGDMATEYWKTDPVDRYQIGPMAALWLGREALVVAEGGYPDGQDYFTYYRMRNDSAELDGYSKPIAPTTTDAADLGEGNYIGLCRMGDTIWACCHGNDKKTWIARCNLSARDVLEPWLSADDAGISTNSPMQALPWRGNLLVLYSGAGGKEDGLLVEWNIETRKPVNQWTLKGLVDPMGMAWVEDREQPTLVVTDNNWSLTQVNKGKIALVTLAEKTAEVTVIASNVPGPVNCAFGPDGRLYVACLGSEFDNNKGLVIAVDGID